MLAATLLAGGVLSATAVAYAAPPKLAAIKTPDIRDSDWVKVDPDNLLVIDTTRGRLLAELYPNMAPQAVERIKILARQHFYDGLVFFRVIDQFMAQTGDPNNLGMGGSALPDLPGEFTFPRTQDVPFVQVTSEYAEMGGMIGAMPVGTQSDALLSMSASSSVAAWGMFCPGVIGMARTDAPNTANSQFFIIRQTSATIDKKYAVIGRVLVGIDAVRLIKVGEPVTPPQDKMTRVRLASDLPAGETVKLARMDPTSPFYRAAAAIIKDRKGSDFTACDLDIPVKQD